MLKQSLLAIGLLFSFSAIANQADTSHEQISHAEPTHIPGIFIGATHLDGETDFTWGVEYEYKFTPSWGAGLVYENTKEGHKGAGTEVKLAEVYFHPTREIRLGVGFGEESVDAHGHHHSFDEDLWRVSAGYDFHLGDFAIAPTIAIDNVDGENATVFELALLMPF